MMLRWLVTQFAQEAIRRQLGEGTSSARAATDAEAPSAAPPLPAPDVLLVSALPIESQGMVERLSRSQSLREQGIREHRGLLGDRSVAVAETGAGPAAAGRAMEHLLDRHAVSWVLAAGFAAALAPGVARGDFVMPEEIVDAEGNCLAVGLQMDPHVLQQTPGLHTGRLLSVEHELGDSEDKQRLGTTHHAVACDMESQAVAAVCRARRIRFLAVRVISDTLEDVLPPDVQRLVQQKSTAAKLGAATGALFRRPGAMKDLWKLHDDAVRTSRRLASFVAGVVPQLA